MASTPLTALPESGAVRLKLVVAYDGTDFHGFAPNAGVETVGGVLRATIEQVLGTAITMSCAGRTDAGVHGWGQVVSFDAPAGVDAARLADSVTRMLGPRVVVRSATVVPADFDARFSARWRRYRYRIVNRRDPDPFLARTSWHVPQPLDLRVLTLCCDPLIGEHDFSSFCRRPAPEPGQSRPSLVRRVLDARWHDEGEGLVRFEVTATSFCHQMVRSVVGTLAEAGMGRRTAGEISGILRARDRHVAGQVAPPHGLCLWEVGY